MANMTGLMDRSILVIEGCKSFPLDRAVYMLSNMSLNPCWVLIRLDINFRWTITKSDPSLLIRNSLCQRGVFNVKLCCRYVTVLIGCEGDEVTVLTNKGVAGLLLKIALLVCLCCRGKERRVQWAAHHVQHLILTLTAHQLTYIPLITHSSLMTVYTAAPHMENNNTHIGEEKYCNYIFSGSGEESQEGTCALFD